MSGASVQVPIVRPPSYAPAWAEKPPGLRVSRVLDLADMLADRQVGLIDATVATEPPLLADTFRVSDVAINFMLGDNPPAAPSTRWHVKFLLQLSDGSQDEVIVLQPIGPADPLGLVPADVTADVLAVGGDVITVGGGGFYV